jgi:hypothetical protein
MLETKGVYNEQRSGPVETVHVRWEDTDHTVYELLDGEETPITGKDGEGYPEGRTYVLKIRLEERPFSAQNPSGNDMQTIGTNLKETLELCTRDVQESAPTQDPAEPEEEDSFPIPEESSSPRWATREEASMKIYRMMKFRAESVEWKTRPRPVWWSPAWEEPAEAREVNGIRIPTGSPQEFKECITDDVFAMDSYTMELQADESTGERIDASVNPELINVASAVIWNARGSTLAWKCDRGQDCNDLVLSLFGEVLKLVPDGGSLTYVTHSDWLYEQWTDMMGWKSVGYQRLDRNMCAFQWKGIMDHVEERLNEVNMVKSSESDIEEKIRNAASLYGLEGVQWCREFLATPVGGGYPPTAPWS